MAPPVLSAGYDPAPANSHHSTRPLNFRAAPSPAPASPAKRRRSLSFLFSRLGAGGSGKGKQANLATEKRSSSSPAPTTPVSAVRGVSTLRRLLGRPGSLLDLARAGAPSSSPAKVWVEPPPSPRRPPRSHQSLNLDERPYATYRAAPDEVPINDWDRELAEVEAFWAREGGARSRLQGGPQDGPSRELDYGQRAPSRGTVLSLASDGHEGLGGSFPRKLSNRSGSPASSRLDLSIRHGSPQPSPRSSPYCARSKRVPPPPLVAMPSSSSTASFPQSASVLSLSAFPSPPQFRGGQSSSILQPHAVQARGDEPPELLPPPTQGLHWSATKGQRASAFVLPNLDFDCTPGTEDLASVPMNWHTSTALLSAAQLYPMPLYPTHVVTAAEVASPSISSSSSTFASEVSSPMFSNPSTSSQPSSLFTASSSSAGSAHSVSGHTLVELHSSHLHAGGKLDRWEELDFIDSYWDGGAASLVSLVPPAFDRMRSRSPASIRHKSAHERHGSSEFEFDDTDSSASGDTQSEEESDEGEETIQIATAVLRKQLNPTLEVVEYGFAY